MSGTAVPLGPFTGGLNLHENASVIDDKQAAELINFDIGRAGELSVRPGLKSVTTVGAGAFVLLGAVRKLDGTYRSYGRDGTQLYYSDDAGVTWATTGTAYSEKPRAIVQYVDPISTTVPYTYFIPRGTGSGTALGGIRQNLNDNTYANVTGMPNGSGCVVYRERLFIYGPTNENSKGSYRVWYSNAKDFTTFGANSWVDIGPGDGEFVTCMAIQNDALLVFKSNSSWVYTFESDPALGVLRKFNSEIGATGPNAVVTSENLLYVIDQRAIFRLVNLLYDDISAALAVGVNVRLAATTNEDSAVALSRRLCFVLATGSATAYKYFVYHLDVNAWSEYQFGQQPNRFVSTGQDTFESFLAAAGATRIYKFSPYNTALVNWGDYPNTDTYVSLKTKRYLFSSEKFKRLFWWTIEAIGSNGSIIAYVDTETTQSAMNIYAVSTTTKVFKQFVASRFRTIQFVIKGGLAAGAGIDPIFTIISAQAFIDEKAKVKAGATS